MVPGAARRMGGCSDALFTALVLPAAVFHPTSATAACCCAHFCITCQISPSPPRFAVTLWTWPISIRCWGERGDELRKP